MTFNDRALLDDLERELRSRFKLRDHFPLRRADSGVRLYQIQLKNRSPRLRFGYRGGPLGLAIPCFPKSRIRSIVSDAMVPESARRRSVRKTRLSMPLSHWVLRQWRLIVFNEAGRHRHLNHSWRIITRVGFTYRWTRTRRQVGPCNRRTSGRWPDCRKLAVFTIDTNDVQRDSWACMGLLRFGFSRCAGSVSGCWATGASGHPPHPPKTTGSPMSAAERPPGNSLTKRRNLATQNIREGQSASR